MEIILNAINEATFRQAVTGAGLFAPVEKDDKGADVPVSLNRSERILKGQGTVEIKKRLIEAEALAKVEAVALEPVKGELALDEPVEIAVSEAPDVFEGAFALNYVGVVLAPTGKMLATEDAHGTLVEFPEMSPVPGVWARLRWNGDEMFLPEITGITVYRIVTSEDGPSFWSSDGKTPAPDYVSNIGLIL